MSSSTEDTLVQQSSMAGVDSLGTGGFFSSDAQDTRIVTARGTEDGLVLRIDGKSEWADILAEIDQFLGGRKKFFAGGEVSIEWLDRLPTVEQGKELEELLKRAYGVEIHSRKKRASQLALAAAKERASREIAARKQEKAAGVTINLFDEVKDESLGLTPSGLGSLGFSGSGFSGAGLSGAGMTGSGLTGTASQNVSQNINNKAVLSELSLGIEAELADLAGKKYASKMAKMLGDDLFYEDDANAKVVYGTLRSGQRLETPFSLIVIGDVNPGADLVAGGDILVFGNLRGTAHASAYDDDAYDRVIIALQMQPMQLRIGSVISRGSDEFVKGAEIARIDNRRIIVEPYNPKALLGRKLR